MSQKMCSDFLHDCVFARSFYLDHSRHFKDAVLGRGPEDEREASAFTIAPHYPYAPSFPAKKDTSSIQLLLRMMSCFSFFEMLLMGVA